MDNFDLKKFLVENKLTFQSSLKEAANVQDVISKLKSGNFDDIAKMPGDEETAKKVLDQLKNQPDVLKKAKEYAEENLKESVFNKNNLLYLILTLAGFTTGFYSGSKITQDTEQSTTINAQQIPVENLTTSQKGIKFIKYEEGDPRRKGSPSLKSYRLPNENGRTMSWGCKYTKNQIPQIANLLNIGKIEAAKIWTGRTKLTLQQAETLFNQKLKSHEKIVKDVFRGHSLTQNQFDALVSIAFNRGEGAFKRGINASEYIENIKKGNMKEASKYLLYSYGNKKFNKSLGERRKREVEIFLNNKYAVG